MDVTTSLHLAPGLLPAKYGEDRRKFPQIVASIISRLLAISMFRCSVSRVENFSCIFLQMSSEVCAKRWEIITQYQSVILALRKTAVNVNYFAVAV